MDPHDYCLARGARSGSSLHYATLFLAPDPRRALVALAALARELDATLDAASDPGVALARLAWWRSELTAGAAGTPSHPVSMALTQCLPADQDTRDLLDRMLEGAEAAARQTRLLDTAALDRHLEVGPGALARLAAEALGVKADTTPLARVITRVRLMRRTGADVRRDRIWLPASELRAHGVRPADLIMGRLPAGWLPLMATQAQAARTDWDEARKHLGPERSARPLLALGRIYMRLLDEIEASGYAVLQQRIELTPVAKLTLAWRTWVFGVR